ncbi:hypothetical protein AJ79_07462 [Helicocarpus griseus UAMH5409]|uniref:Integral membrane protein n=1 Tax=Helicocarpus griseus UAMH5409 TaxID=1447875 RepID=A0A2B7X2G1_9EURO|nr:hypothetical protein AJ79_07462 [Helicocarpus griseus UAMH5409]
MGKGGRIACIFTPYLLTVGALICLILVALGLYKSSGPMTNVYFVKADFKDLDPDSTGLANDLLPFTKGLQQADAQGIIHDFYLIGFWNHCYGKYDTKSKKYQIEKCTDRKTRYWFNPVDEWGLDEFDDDKADGKSIMPEALDKGVSAYKKVAGWMFIAFVVAFVTTALEMIVAIAAVFSRWGSLVVTIISAVSSFFYFAAAITATAMYTVFISGVNTSLKPYKVKADLGKDMFAIIWIGVAFSLASGIFWMFSVCCCSGRSPYGHTERRNGSISRRTTAEKTPYTYERVSSPYSGARGGGAGDGATAPLTSMPQAPGGRDMAYEPFRHDGRT